MNAILFAISAHRISRHFRRKQNYFVKHREPAPRVTTGQVGIELFPVAVGGRIAALVVLQSMGGISHGYGGQQILPIPCPRGKTLQCCTAHAIKKLVRLIFALEKTGQAYRCMT